MSILEQARQKLDPTRTAAARPPTLVGSPPPARPTEPRHHAAIDAVDSETLDVVTRFESLYAELAPAPEPRQEPGLDDLVIDFGDAPAQGCSAKPADARVEPRVASRLTTRTEARARGEREHEPAPDFTLDDALALLKSVENRAAPATRRAEDTTLPAAPQPSRSAAATVRVSPVLPDTAPMRESTGGESTERKWMTVLVVAVAALTAGAGLGYFAATQTGAAQLTPIPITAQGGAGLRLDFELRAR